MNYIYDIHLNLNSKLYDFFDWNKNDKIIHIKKIPIYKIGKIDFMRLVNYRIRIDTFLLNSLYNKTEIWNIKSKIPYCALFCDDNSIIGIEFNEKGISLNKSFLFIDEELEILETTNRIIEKEIEFETISKYKSTLKTRNQVNQESFVNNELKNIEEAKLQYIFFECFGKRDKNKKNVLKKIRGIEKNSKEYKNLYNILKLTSTAKNKML